MPTAPTYPGVYIEEVPSGVRTITGVATSVAAFLGSFSRGPMNEAVRILSFGDFERTFGGLRKDSEAAYAIQQFFLNGGGQAYVVRTAGEVAGAAASVTLRDETGADVLTLTASEQGTRGDTIRVEVDYDASNQGTEFNVTISIGATTEIFSDLTPATAVTAINGTSALVVASEPDSPPGTRPVEAGTMGAQIATTGLSIPQNEDFEVFLDGASLGMLTWTSGAGTISGVASALETLLRGLTGLGSATVEHFDTRLLVRTNTGGDTDVVTFAEGGSSVAAGLGLDVAIASPQRFSMAGGVDAGPVSAAADLSGTMSGTTVLSASAINEGRWGDGITVVVDHETADPSLGTQFNLTVSEGGASEVFRNLVLDPASSRYAVAVVNGGSAILRLSEPSTAPDPTDRPVRGTTALMGGTDGRLPGASALIGTEADKSGMYALLDVDLFNLLCIPDTMRLPNPDAAQVAAAATALAHRERAFYILDAPQDVNDPLDLPSEMEAWVNANASLRHQNVALYYPRPAVADPLNDFRLREVAPSGTMAGVYARTDATRGVWKAPAGTEAVLRGTQRLEYTLTDAENGVLNPLAVNALRTFPVTGTVAWGARTLLGADQLASEWKYVPVRRLALYIEESLFRGTQWAVFEPNDETLWSQMRLNVGTFMHTLFRQGAFQGSSPRDSYFVKCDAESNPQADIDRGIVNVMVGFAPLKPAEFVIVKIQQMAGQLEA
ncbi:MAG: phage tail sheath C-terminal domain-containing protein [Bacteroidota bacterium]